MSRPMAAPGWALCMSLLECCTVTKLLLMRFCKAPNQAVPPCILANSLKNNSFWKTIANWDARRRFVLLMSMLGVQPSQARVRNAIIHARDIAEEGERGHRQPNVEWLTLMSSMSPDSQMQIWQPGEVLEYHSSHGKLIKSDNAQLMLTALTLYK